MKPQSTSQHLAAALVQAGSYGRTSLAEGRQPSPSGAVPFTVAVSREVGARGTSVAAEVGARLGWPVYDQELVERIAREMNLRVQLVKSVDERGMSWVEEFMENFASAPGLTENAYLRHLIQTLLSLGRHGQCVIVGRGAAHLLPAATTLRIRLVASLEDRIAVMSRELGVSEHEAARRVEALDRERSRFIKDHFRKDPTDPRNYDLVLNASRFSVGQCADMVIEALRRLEEGEPERRT